MIIESLFDDPVPVTVAPKCRRCHGSGFDPDTTETEWYGLCLSCDGRGIPLLEQGSEGTAKAESP